MKIDRLPRGAPIDEEAPAHSITHGLRWSLLGQVGLRLLTFGTGIVLARVLAPQDFGTYAIALAVVNLLGAVNEMGVMPAIVRWQGHPLQAVRTSMTLAGLNSLMLYLGLFVSAPWLAAMLGAPEATAELRVLGLTVLADGLSAPYQALLHRSFAQHLQARSEVAGMVVYAATAIALATAGLGGMSIAIGSVLGAATTGGLFVLLAPFRTWPGWSQRDARELLGFGTPLALAALLSELVLNIDYIIVAAILGTTDLGLYLLAFNLASWPVTTVSMAVGKVSFAGFATVAKDKSQLADAAARAAGLALSVAVPLVVLLAVLAPDVVRLLYGEKWIGASEAVRFLVILGGLRLVFDLLGDCVAASGRPRHVLGIRLAWFVALVPMVVLGAREGGLVGVGAAHVGAALAVASPLLLWALARAGVRPAPLGRAAIRPLLGGAGMLAAVLLASSLVESSLLRVLLLVPIGVTCYAALLIPGNDLLRWAVTQARATSVGKP